MKLTKDMMCKGRSASLLTIGLSIVCLILLVIVLISSTKAWAIIAKTQASNTEVISITLIENYQRLVIYNDASCSLNMAAQIKVDEIHQVWNNIIENSSLLYMTSLTILEQVKFQISKTKVVMAVNENEITKLVIESPTGVRSIELVSVDTMHMTYPNADLLEQFMLIVILMRDASAVCKTS